jgi:hypothetical protein
MKRLILVVVGAYLLAAVVTRAAEAAGVGRTCGCHSDCWCKKRGLTLFRWVMPRRTHHTWTEDEKRAFAEASAGE